MASEPQTSDICGFCGSCDDGWYVGSMEGSYRQLLEQILRGACETEEWWLCNTVGTVSAASCFQVTVQTWFEDVRSIHPKESKESKELGLTWTHVEFLQPVLVQLWFDQIPFQQDQGISGVTRAR